MTAALDKRLARNVFRVTMADVSGHVERTVVARDGVTLAVRDFGADIVDAPTVVLLHGLCLSQDSWQSQVCLLRRRWGNSVRIITYDHRGHGRSADAPMSTYRIDQLADDLAEVLSASRITGPLTLAGHSMGGMTALEYLGRPAAQRPVEPQGLVLVGTAAGGIAERGVARLLSTPATAALFGIVDHMPRRATDNAVSALLRPVGAVLSRISGSVDGAVALVAEAIGTASLTTATGFLPTLKRFNAYRMLESVTAKTIIVSGGSDALTPASHSRDMAAAIPGAVHLHHPSASHMLLQDASECVGIAIGRALGMPRRPGYGAAVGLSPSCTAHLAAIAS